MKPLVHRPWLWMALVACLGGVMPGSSALSVDHKVSSDSHNGGTKRFNFRLDTKSKVTFKYDARANVPHGNLFRIRIKTRSPSGGWRNLGLILHIFGPESGEESGELPAAEYQVEVTARRMSYDLHVTSEAVNEDGQ